MVRIKITFVTVSATAIKYLMQASNYINLNYGEVLKLNLYYATSEVEDAKSKAMYQNIKDSDLVFVDLMGSPPFVIKLVYSAIEQCSGNIIPYGNSAREYLKLGKFTMESMKKDNENKKMDMAMMKKMQNMAQVIGKIMPGKMRDMRNYIHIMKYYTVADRENILNMLYLMLREYGGIKNVPKPKEPRVVEDVSICDPNIMKVYNSFDEYYKQCPFKKDKPTIVMLFHGNTYPVDTYKCVAQIKNRLDTFANVLPIAISGSFVGNKEKLEKLILKSNTNPIDLILNFKPFRFTAGPMGGDFKDGIKLLEKADVPYLHPFFMTRRTTNDWKESTQGCTPSEVLISVMLPELDGCIETYPIAAMSESKYDNQFDILTDELEIIEERLERFVSRIKRQLVLCKKSNAEKRIAIICYNYPPGESNLFSAAFLDTFASVENVLEKLKHEGYCVNALKKEELMKMFTAGKIVNSGRYSDEWENSITYNYKELEQDLKSYSDYEEMIKQWGKPPGTIMVNDDQKFLIPGIVQDNVFIGLQPSRGIHEEREKNYHDKTLLPHYQYHGFYKWIREEFKADAIIHVGTHGTLEFLSGKECGISRECYADRLLEDIPHMYLYYCGNPSEAIIAKRRANANLIGYQPPVFVESELYGEYSKLMSLVDNYRQALAVAPESSKDILADIFNMSEKLNIPKELEIIESELYRMNRSLIPKGLHVFGNGFSNEEAMDYTKGILRYGRNGVKSLRDCVGKAKGYDIEILLSKGDYESIKEIDKDTEEIYKHYMLKGELSQFKWINEDNKQEFINILEYGKSIWKVSQENYEIEGLLRVLSGKYNPAKLAGDVYRYPDILPTGYNLYQFDPRIVPTSTAYDRGNKICENTLKAYIKENNCYSLSTAVILWGLETSRTQGETFSQILSYLGVKISQKRTEWDFKYEIIPIEKLGRPRIDVTINICGFFRDMFSNLIESLHDIFIELYELEESDEDNYFKSNSRKLFKKLLDEGYDEKEAKELAISRIFGPKEGEYGTGITEIVEMKNWDQENEIGNEFINSLQYVYNRNIKGVKVNGLYEENLKSVEIVSQIRSDQEYEIIDLDHYYEFFGGLAKSVEIVKGKKAKMYITDTTEEIVVTESIEKSIERGIRTRVLNPKWIDGMLEHKYHGAQKIAKRFENIMGLAATTNSVEEWIYDELYNCYVDNKDLSKRLEENNPYAYINILEEMMEYHKRDYWKAKEDQLKKIKEKYLEVEGNIEEEL